MQSPDVTAEAVAFFTEIRQLAAANPREARARFAELIDGDALLLEAVLSLASAPGEGRLRQMIANLARQRGDKGALLQHLARWLETETDEFAAAAINSALAGVDASTFRVGNGPDLPGMVTTYRYVAERLCHRVRNALTGPVRHLYALEALLANGASEAGQNAEAQARVTQLFDALREVSRLVDFNLDDTQFEWRLVELGGWLRTMHDTYRRQNPEIALQMEGPLERGEVLVKAAEYHLNNLFWNLWKNAQQAVEGPCRIVIGSTISAGHAELRILDNGNGFSKADAELAFQGYFRARGDNHGRGLMEVQDAAARLSGSARMFQETADRFRIAVILSLVTL